MKHDSEFAFFCGTASTPSSEESLLAWSDVPGAVEDISLEMCKVFWNPIDSCRFVIFFKAYEIM